MSNADRWPTAHAGWQALRVFWQAKQDIGFDHHITPAARQVLDAFPGATIAPEGERRQHHIYDEEAGRWVPMVPNMASVSPIDPLYPPEIAPAADPTETTPHVIDEGAVNRRGANIPPLTQPWQRPDDGPPVDLERTKAAIIKAIGGDPTVEADIKRWVAEGTQAGRCWRITTYPHTRPRHIYRVAVRLSKWADDDDEARTALGLVLNVGIDEPVGAALGSLTSEQAQTLVGLLDELDAGTSALVIGDDGQPYVKAA
jgi:hypothetical protein